MNNNFFFLFEIKLNMKSICQGCGICCLKTEMPLFLEDLIRIQEFVTPDRSSSFYIEENGNKYLKNIDDHCYFFDITTKKCKIYDIRPLGCRFYPMVYDIDYNKCILDSDCPRRYRFYTNQNKFKESCVKLTKIMKEYFSKLRC